MRRGKYTSDCSGEAFTLLQLLFLNNMLGYADRTNLSVAVIAMSRELGWGEASTGTLLASFFCGYVLTQIPAGLAAARFGAKRVLLVGTVVLVCGNSSHAVGRTPVHQRRPRGAHCALRQYVIRGA